MMSLLTSNRSKFKIKDKCQKLSVLQLRYKLDKTVEVSSSFNNEYLFTKTKTIMNSSCNQNILTRILFCLSIGVLLTVADSNENDQNKVKSSLNVDSSEDSSDSDQTYFAPTRLEGINRAYWIAFSN